MTTVGIDLGDGQLTVVAVDESGAVTARAARRGSTDPSAVEAAYREVRNSAGNIDRVGVTLPFGDGAVPDSVLGVLRTGAGEVPATVRPGQAVALAESWCGAARGCGHVVAFSIGEHVTAGVLVSGSLLKGANGDAGSVAWLALNPVEREDYRRHGGLEAEVSAAGIVRRLVWRIKSGDRSRVVERVDGDLTRLTVDDVFAAAREGDGVCASVVRDTAKYVGMAVANLATIMDPECVVLGGSLAASGDLMLDGIRTECARRLRPAQCERIRIALSSLGAEAAAIGAARAALLERS